MLDITKGCGILAKLLYFIFNLSLENRVFSIFWKTSFITLLLKSGDNSQVTNYKPISIHIINSIIKVFENFIRDFLSATVSFPHRSSKFNVLSFIDFGTETFGGAKSYSHPNTYFF